MDGILIIDKPAGITSHDVIDRVRRILKTKKVGHTGTLDPFATGVMVVLVGQATRLAQFLDKDAKEYVAGVQFGYATDTGDLTGEPLTEPRRWTPDAVTVKNLAAVLPSFLGEQMQIPPMYSAKKVEGKRLYEMAREGKEIERQPVRITVHEIEIGDTSSLAASGLAQIRIRCSAGTYIRTLGAEIAKALGTSAHLVSLRRAAAGEFTISEARTLDELADLPDPIRAMLSLDRAVSHLREFRVPDSRVEKTRNGLSSRVYESDFCDGETVRMTANGHIIAVGIYNESENFIQPKIVLG